MRYSCLMAALEIPSLFDHYRGSGEAIVIAVSGGGDSMALLDLYRAAKARNNDLPSPIVVTVDHGLRSGFASEAALVEVYCRKHDLPWRLVSWEGKKPQTGIMAAARLARYRLLAAVALDIGTTTILTGHTLDDQFETLSMRAARGLAQPMESAVLFDRRVIISRPLLEIRRLDLRAYLTKSNIGFADDPTNTNMRFERARVRAGVKPETLSLLPSDNRKRQSERAAKFILQNVKIENGGVFIARPDIFDQDADIFALRYVAASLGQFDYPAPLSVGSRLFELLGHGHNGQAYTAQRCHFLRKTGGIFVTNDARHKNVPHVHGRIAPLEIFCGQSLIPVANALAETLAAPPFIWPQRAAI